MRRLCRLSIAMVAVALAVSSCVKNPPDSTTKLRFATMALPAADVVPEPIPANKKQLVVRSYKLNDFRNRNNAERT